MWAGNCSSTRICLGSAEGRWRLRDKPGGTAAQSYLQTSANLLKIGTVYNQKHARRVAEMLIFQTAAILYSILQKMTKQNNGKKLEKTPGFVIKPGVSMELLGRFELPTSSLPIRGYAFRNV